MLRMVLGVLWRDNISNDILYGNLPKLSDKIRSRRLKLAGHYMGGGGGKATTIFLTIWPTSRCHGLDLAHKIFDHDQNFKVFVVK